jgi:hypothetical protein
MMVGFIVLCSVVRPWLESAESGVLVGVDHINIPQLNGAVLRCS